MPTLENNLTALSIAVTDLKAWMPMLDEYLPEGHADWSAQLAAGKQHALEHAHSSTGKDPAWLRPQNLEHWKRVLVAATLFVIFDPGQTEPWEKLSAKWHERFLTWFGRTRLEHDEDRTGTISDSVTEGARAPREIELVRG